MTIAKKFMLVLGLIFVAGILMAILAVYQHQRSTVGEQAENESARISREAVRLLTVTDAIMLERVKSSMALLKEYGAEFGEPRLGEPVRVNDRDALNLYLGETPIANAFDLVDHVTQIMGGTATIFARDRDEFVRISTNVMTPTGRAIGTILAPQGAAIKQIQQGRAFYGVVDILGNPYVTGYEPIVDSTGATIGIWYVGYKADLTDLFTAIAASRVLQNGFVVLRDNTGKTRIHSDNLSLEAVDDILANPGDNWTLNSSRFDPWGYEIVTAYSNDEISSMVRQVSLMLGLLIVVVGVVALVIVYLLIQSVVIRPLKQTTARLQDIVSGEGDLTLRFHSRSKDELGQLANGFDLLMDRLQGTIRSVSQSTQQLTSSAAHLKDIALHTSDTITHQTRDIDAIAAAIHEMSATAHEVARNAASVAMATAKADSEAQQGHKILNDTIQATEALAGKIENAAKVISALADASNEIGAVLNVIRSIAEQTNLLALNAAIEAARAGEQGRGFAVVADEVRSLASRTQASTEEVDKMVQRFQSNSLKAFEQMRMAEETVRTNVATAQESGSSIKTVLRTVSELNNLNTEISHSVDQQSQVAEDINKNITRINNTGDQSQERAAETLRASEGLSKLSEDIQRQLAAYRV